MDNRNRERERERHTDSPLPYKMLSSEQLGNVTLQLLRDHFLSEETAELLKAANVQADKVFEE